MKKLLWPVKFLFWGSLALLFGFLKVLWGPRMRWLTAALCLSGLVYGAWQIRAAPELQPARSRDELSEKDVQALLLALRQKLRVDGENMKHIRRLYGYAPAFSRAAGARLPVVRAAALLHDSTKEKGLGEPKVRFCTHGEQGADFAKGLLSDLGKSPAFVREVEASIRQHMGPRGFDWRHLRRRFMSRFCKGYRFPAPGSLEARVLYDIDMLDLMTLGGLIKVVTFRQSQPEFGEETVKQSAWTGSDSAWRSVIEAGQTLQTQAAQKCGAQLERYAEQFLQQVDWPKIVDHESFARSARAYQARVKAPSCLPPPSCGDGQGCP